jgi:NodT family efflux transporter outer membrane factor (OMF) lipoprotein
MRHIISSKIVIYLLAILLGACASPPDRTEHKAEFLKGEYARNIENGISLDSPYTQWWSLFKNDELNQLIDEALKNNPDINQTRKRLEQAAASADKTFAELLPSVTLSLEKGKTRTESTSAKSISLLGAASYELDLWGKNRSSYRAEELEAEASLQDLLVSAITLSASVTENWLRLMASQDEHKILNQQLEINVILLDLQQTRYESGVALALDVLQQKELLAKTKAKIPDVESNKEILSQQLSILVGRTPSQALAIKTKGLPEILPLPTTGLPSKLLEQRPDIIAAWLRLLSSDWAAAAAQRDRLPAFNLAVDYTTTAVHLDALFDSWLLNLAANIALPIIDGGKRRAEVVRQRALADERFHAYREVVLKAIGEVEGALTRNHFQEKKVTALKDELLASRAALEQAHLSYFSGNSGYINILSGLLNVQNLERQLVLSQRDLALERVNLYRTLGSSGWTHTIIEAKEHQDE